MIDDDLTWIEIDVAMRWMRERGSLWAISLRYLLRSRELCRGDAGGFHRRWSSRERINVTGQAVQRANGTTRLRPWTQSHRRNRKTTVVLFMLSALYKTRDITGLRLFLCWALSPKFTSSTCLVLVERMEFAETRPPASNYFPPLNASSAKALQRPILSLCVGRDFTHVFVALLVLAALPRMQFTLSKYSSPFPAITLIPSPNATGQISNKTDWRNRLSSYTDKEVVNSSPGKNWLSERFSFSQIWYSRACRTSRGDKLSLGKPFISPTQTSAVCIMSIM